MADATMTRATPVAAACSARARADATLRCGAMPRYGSTSCETNGRTRRSASASESPSSADRKNRTSAVICSTSASVGTITMTVSSCSARDATNSPLADGVRPDTSRAGAPIRVRAVAVFRRARRLRELEVVKLVKERPSK
jgi:hypothetical protein